MIGILLDSSALYALADEHDKWHRAMALAVGSQAGERVVPITVLTEACYMIGTHLGPTAERRLMRATIGGEFLLEGLGLPDLARAERVLEKYADADIGLVDASIVALAERLKIQTIATTDRRHLRLFRPRHFRAFHLLPQAALLPRACVNRQGASLGTSPPGFGRPPDPPAITPEIKEQHRLRSPAAPTGRGGQVVG